MPSFSKQGFAEQRRGETPDRRGANSDGTSELLSAGFWILLAGAVTALLTKTVFGGIGEHGPHTNSGWMALVVSMMCLPFGSMLTVLGAAKWLRRRRMAKAGRRFP